MKIKENNIQISTPNILILRSNGVKHIPQLKRNLLSIGQHDVKRYSVTFVTCRRSSEKP